jgi:hypothetical protein
MKLAPICLCLLLAGCETTSFQAPPVAAAACDRALVGTWDSIGDKREENGEVELRIDDQCMLLFIEHEKDGTKEGTPTQLHVGNDNGSGYLWVDGAWVASRFDMKQAPPAGDIFLVRYRIKNDQLTLQAPDDKAIAHRIIDGKINGEVRRIDGNLDNRILAPIDPAVLRQPGFFDKEKAELRRRTPGSTHG